ncbi:MAG: bifunctional adenosylcobinamide kinase/adenosylcobinamide-phosphate guanylyltransferase [Acidimicrobiia bacterium]|nr:bifunctional adenosylcobinamide kinase/adenosylcobinamide-phosphate guanylyltransferase [Acidimicrobiia bacterium]MDH5236811.1 bifunctional adenosylcobinamide kinase/adenosylcobinamide-phosphate guanylyltransferase [Acidimicrobiia bacterium]
MTGTARAILLLGGARSGKSRLAVDLATVWTVPVTVVVTATAGDDDMTDRIRRHRIERPPGWTTVEAPEDLIVAITAVPADHGIVLDCLTMWAANNMLAEQPDETVVQTAAVVADRLMARPGPAVVVTNEVGSGVVPATVSGRAYRDLLGRVNRSFADRLDATYLVAAGLVTELHSPRDVFRELGGQA